jgi:hypothetical protein
MENDHGAGSNVYANQSGSDEGSFGLFVFCQGGEASDPSEIIHVTPIVLRGLTHNSIATPTLSFRCALAHSSPYF